LCSFLMRSMINVFEYAQIRPTSCILNSGCCSICTLSTRSCGHLASSLGPFRAAPEPWQTAHDFSCTWRAPLCLLAHRCRTVTRIDNSNTAFHVHLSTRPWYQDLQLCHHCSHLQRVAFAVLSPCANICCVSCRPFSAAGQRLSDTLARDGRPSARLALLLDPRYRTVLANNYQPLLKPVGLPCAV
jgi:hypothetical protein